MKKCKLCGEIIKVRTIVDGKMRNFQRRKYCLKCSPFGSGNTRKIEIPKCSVENRKKRKSDKSIRWQKKARKERKNTLISIFGGKCQICGYNRCHKSFDFHHVDPSKKDSAISAFGLLSKWKKIVQEMKKCILVCSNCHREIHANFISQKLVEDIYKNNLIDISKKLDKEIEHNIKKPKLYFCIDCNKEIDQRSKRCHICYKITRQNKNKPTKEQLLIEIKEENNYCAIGRKYGVSDNAVRKWAIGYDLIR